MRVPLSWINDFAPVTGDAVTLAHTLDELGLVVEEIVRIGAGLEDVVVARVEEISSIEGADRIRRVVVDAGGGPVEVVCGAWNFEVGDLVPLAPVGAVLPGDFEIARRKMKGVVSNGMLCSPRELELAEDHQGILIVGGSPEPGTPIMTALGIDPDVVFEISVEANRPDAGCVAGVARDLAAKLKVPFALPDPADPALDDKAGSSVTPGVTDLASVEVVDRDLCPRFTARVLGGVAVGPSPAWLARRLTLAGMRPINNVVDASNYVMLELGQPTHPYDLDRLPGSGLRVRAAVVGERLVTLDDVERRFGERSVGGGDDRRDCLICDGQDTPVGIGGIMGGASSEITEETTRVLLEAAYFTPMAVARTSKRLGLRTEASARFERGCDPAGIDRAAARFAELLGTGGQKIDGAPGVIDVRGEVPGPLPLQLRTSRVNAVLGTSLSAGQVSDILGSIGFGTREASADLLDVTVPTFRPDTAREIDLIEEVARHHGYGNIARRRPQAPQVGGLTDHQRRRRALREVVAGLGAHEAWTNSMLAPGDHERCGRVGGVQLANPLTPDEAVLRHTLMPGLVRALAFNADRRQGELRLFEIGNVFPDPDAARVAQAFERKGTSVIDERETLAVMLAGPGDDARTAAAVWHLLEHSLGLQAVHVRNAWEAGAEAGAETEVAPTGAGLHPSRRGELVGPAGVVGVLGEIDPDVLDAFGVDSAQRRVGWIEVDLALLFDAVPSGPGTATAISRFPSADIDLAFVVADQIPAAAVQATLSTAGGELLESVRLFDVYRAGAATERSLAYRLRFCAADHTLGDDELRRMRSACIDAVVAAHGATLRG